MSIVTPSRVAMAGLALAFVMVTLYIGAAIVRSYEEYEEVRVRESRAEAQLAAVQAEFRKKERYLNLLLSEPAFLERVVRVKLGYARPGERVFRFEAPGDR